MRPPARCLASLTVLSVIVASATDTHAQAQGFALDRFNPSERGSEWFEEDTLDLRGQFRGAAGIVAEFADRPLVIYNADGSTRSIPVQYQMILHPGASVNLVDRFRLAFDLPVGVYEHGTTGSVNHVTYPATDAAGVGDLRLSADVRIFGHYGDAFTLAAGLSFFVPFGSQDAYLSDGEVRLLPHVAAAGDIGPIAYAAHVGVQYRPLDDAFPSYPTGTELDFGGSVGIRLVDRKLLLGPEVYGSTVLTSSSAVFSTRQTPVEGLFGGHYTFARDWRAGVGVAAGFTGGFGEPAFRAVGSVEWTPAYVPPVYDRDGDGILDTVDACPDVPGIPSSDPTKNGCPDRDRDGIFDGEDACPDVPGIRTDDPRTNGCPDRDRDGIPDAIDACPDTPGVKTDDPKTNGCPPDRDHDGVLDTEDACPDTPGVRTKDPRTNGCPPDPDRDKDGIPNELDACPDDPGPKDPDPKRNGCPKAFIKDGQIRILDQVKFATASAAIVRSKDSEGVLDAVRQILVDHPEVSHVHIEGHTDDRGTAAYNLTLSSKRAASVVDWLVHHGIKADRLSSEGLGLTRPIEPNSTEDGRRANRRVEFHIIAK